MSTSSRGGERGQPDDTQVEGRVDVGVAETLTNRDELGAEPAAIPEPAAVASSSRIRMPRVTALVTGMMVGEYKVEAKLGEGGMGTVYGAVHPLIGKRAAIKVLKRELCNNPEAVERFVLEARSVNQIGHPNIVDIFAFGELADGRNYFVMEWLRGESLGQRMQRGRLSFGECIEILDAVIRGLEAAHDKGIIHRDLKPDNVFLVEVRSERPAIKLLDFGIAKLTGGEDNRLERTRTGALIGTPQYIAPEQARGFAIDHRADIYSLGVMAFEMFTGRPPFQAETAMDMIAKHLHDAPPKPSTIAPLPAELDRVIFEMLDKAPGNRPELTAVRKILDEIRSASVNVALLGTVPELTVPASVRATRQRRGALIGGTVALCLAGAAGLWLAIRPGPVATPAAPAAPPIAAGPSPTPTPTPAPPPPVVPVATAPVGIGTLALEITGGDPAHITIDGAAVAARRKQRLTLAPGPHQIQVSAPGRKPAAMTVTVVAGKIVIAKVELVRHRDRPGAGGGSAKPGPGAGSGSAVVKPPLPGDDEGVINAFTKKTP